MLNYIPEGHLIRVRVAVTHVPATVAITALTIQAGQLIPHRISIQCQLTGFGYTEHFLNVGGQDLLQLSVQPVDFLPYGALALVSLDLVSTELANTLVKCHICSGFIAGLNGLTYPDVVNNMSVPACNAIIEIPFVPVAGLGFSWQVRNNLRVKLQSYSSAWTLDANVGNRHAVIRYTNGGGLILHESINAGHLTAGTSFNVYGFPGNYYYDNGSISHYLGFSDIWLYGGSNVIATMEGIKGTDAVNNGRFLFEAIPWM